MNWILIYVKIEMNLLHYYISTKPNQTNMSTFAIKVNKAERVKVLKFVKEKHWAEFRRAEDELRAKTFNIILKEDNDLLKRPSEFNDPKKMKKIKKLSNQLFETYKKSMGDLLDKYKISKNWSSPKDMLSSFRFFIREARKTGEKKPIPFDTCLTDDDDYF